MLVGAGTTATSVEQVVLNNPPASLYRIELDGFSVPEGTSEVDVIDSYMAARRSGR